MLANYARTFQNSDDSYRVIGVNIAHIHRSDVRELERIAGDLDWALGGMIGSRSTGFFVKLYTAIEHTEESVEGFSEAFQDIIHSAWWAGFGMVEFDTDATIYDNILQVYQD